jgi:hypothetical protein
MRAAVAIAALLGACRPAIITAHAADAGAALPSPTAEGPTMTPKTERSIRDRLRDADAQGVKELAAAILRRARTDARLAVEASLRETDPTSRPALTVTVDLEEVAIVPLLEPPLPEDFGDRGWIITLATGQEIELRHRIAARVDSLLENTARVAPGQERVCDAAYLLMAKIVRWKRAPPHAAAVFLRGSDEARDAQIEVARQSPAWTAALGGRTVDDLVPAAEADAGPARGVASGDARSVLDRLPTVDFATQTALSKALAQAERAPGRTAVDAFLDEDVELSHRARELLVGLEELAILPLVERTAVKAEAETWMIERAVVAEGELRAKTVAGLEALLEDKRPIPQSYRRGTERVPPRARV